MASMTVIRVGGQHAMWDTHTLRWAGAPSDVLEVLNGTLPEEGFSPSEPNIGRAAAEIAVVQCGAEIVSLADNPPVEPGLIY